VPDALQQVDLGAVLARSGGVPTYTPAGDGLGIRLRWQLRVSVPFHRMHDKLRILIVGGYGIFGGRLVELLEDDARLTLLVAGRSLAAARKYCQGRTKAAATLVPTLFDRTSDDTTQLTVLNVTVVVDASGPFQAYGSNGYRLIEQCIACKLHYLDLADGSGFVSGISKFDAAAHAAGVYVLSGVSSFPVLTAAVVRRLSAGFRNIQSIRGGIAPSPYAGVGLNVIRAIASYSGQKIPLKRSGRSATGNPFTESMSFVISVPGRIPLENRRFSLVDVPDLHTLAERWPQATDVWMGASPGPAPLHWALTGFAWLVRIRLLPNLSWMASAMHFVTNHVRWGQHRGGMFVEVEGRNANGHSVVREWHLLAEGDDGPLIPCMAVEAVIRKTLSGEPPPAGARTAISDVDLSNYEALFARRTIFTGTRERAPAPAIPLYERILGVAWEQLASEIRQLHSVTAVSSFSGRCSIERGRNPLAWLIATVIGFPKAGADQRMTVQLTKVGDGERWVRKSGRSTFSSVQVPGRGRSEWLLRERFGPITVDLALVVDGQTLHYIVRRWGLFGISLPLFLGPRSTAVESAKEGQFCFDVTIGHPLTGLIVRYRGLLTAVT
jgi:Domain of unknown function (DUF4166)/Saccharopine dehydrogenase NADP binding domain